MDRDPFPRYHAASSILLVDSDALLCERLARELSARGWRSRIAHTAQQALESARGEPPLDAIVALRLPDRTGIKLIPELLAIEPRMRIVVFTGYPSIHTAIEAIKLGATYYVPKPATVSQLLAALERRLGDADASLDEDPMSLHRNEWEYMIHTLQQHNGNISATARALSIDRRTLQRKLQKRPTPSGIVVRKLRSG